MEDIKAFIESYRNAWGNVMNDRKEIGALTPFFHVPCMMIGVDGTMSQYDNERAIVAFNESRLDAFKVGGATAANLRGSDVQSLGNHLAVAIVNWELKRSDGSTERAWRHYYSIRRTPAACKILVSTFHLGS